MGEYVRLANYIIDYFPEPKYSRQDIKDWAEDKIPAWKHISKNDKKEVLDDWEDFIAPQVESEIEGKSPRFWARIKKFLGRLF